jgi:hypothetical protein
MRQIGEAVAAFDRGDGSGIGLRAAGAMRTLRTHRSTFLEMETAAPGEDGGRFRFVGSGNRDVMERWVAIHTRE